MYVAILESEQMLKTGFALSWLGQENTTEVFVKLPNIVEMIIFCNMLFLITGQPCR
jgi:hypothetical protein